MCSGQRNWDGTASFLSFLMGVVSSEISNLANGSENKKTVRGIPQVEGSFTHSTTNLDHYFETERSLILQELQNDTVCYDIAKLIIDHYINRPRKIPEVLNIGIKDIYNAKKRLRARITKLKEMGIFHNFNCNMTEERHSENRSEM